MQSPYSPTTTCEGLISTTIGFPMSQKAAIDGGNRADQRDLIFTDISTELQTSGTTANSADRSLARFNWTEIATVQPHTYSYSGWTYSED